MKRSSAVISVSVPPDSAREFERLAEREGRNKSELFREMLAVYLTYQETRTFASCHTQYDNRGDASTSLAIYVGLLSAASIHGATPQAAQVIAKG